MNCKLLSNAWFLFILLLLYIIFFNSNVLEINYRLSNDAQEEYWTSCDEVNDTFDAMGLKENLLRHIYANYAYGI
jgi:hypothetical protein